MHVPASAVAALREKYAEIKRLRDAASAGDASEPRAQMAALARRFPGALRELDELPIELIEQRLARLDQLLREAGRVPQWVQLQIAYHGWMRVALRIKGMRVRAGAQRVHAVEAELARSYVPDADEPALECLDRDAIEAILKPVNGRLNPWVFQRVAQLFGVEPACVQRALFIARGEQSGAGCDRG